MKAAPRARKPRLPALPKQIDVELAVLDRELPRGAHWTFEIKYDGFRTIAYLDHGHVHLESRNALSFDERFPQVRAAVTHVRATQAILDGEVCALDEAGKSSFEKLAGGDAKKGSNLVYFVFDLLWIDGEDLRALPQRERRARLDALLPRTSRGVVRGTPAVDDGEALLEAAREMRLEGVIAKDTRAPYRGARSGAFRKIKIDQHQDLAIVGFTPPRGSRTALGALLLGYWDPAKQAFVFAGKVGTGFTQASLVQVAKALKPSVVPKPLVQGAPRMRDAIWVEPKLVAEIRFSEWTRDGRLRHPSFLGLRPDKHARDTGREEPPA